MPPPPRATIAKTSGPGETSTFVDVGKAAADLLSKDFAVGKVTAEFKSSSVPGLAVTATGAHTLDFGGGCCKVPPTPPGASVTAECKPLAGVTAKVRLDQTGVANSTLDAKWSSLLKLSASVASQPAGSADKCPLGALSCGMELGLPSLSAQATYDALKKSASASLVKPASSALPVTTAISFGYCLSTSAILSRAAKVSYGLPGHYTATAFLSDAGSGKGVAYGCSVHSAAGGLQLASELRVSGGKAVVAAAVSAPIAKGITAKAKVGTDSMLALSLKHSLSKAVTATFAGCVDLSLDPSKTKAGFHLALSP